MSIQAMFAVEGMTLRDWFAGQALAGRLAGAGASSAAALNTTELAAWAYSLAQEMMAQREKLYSAEEQALWGFEDDPQGQPPQAK